MTDPADSADSDRALLEAAARAAGLAYGTKRSPTGADALYIGPGNGWWNPLTDDGDALRLAVKMRITQLYYDPAPPELQLPRVCSVACLSDGRWFAESTQRGDELAATRRAIVRAAAQCQPEGEKR